MFVTKFIVPVTRKFHNNVSRFSLCKPRRNNTVLSEKSKNAKRIITSSKCKEYGEKLASCPKPSNEVFCGKKLFSKSTPGVKNACTKFNVKPQTAKRITPSKCKEYADKLALCPKPSNELFCCKKWFSKSTPGVKNACTKLNVKPETAKRITPSKCKEYADKLALCPKPSNELFCCKKWFSKSTPGLKNACKKFNVKPRSAKIVITPSRCKEYAEKLALCPKPSREHLCSKQLFSKSVPEVNNSKVKLVVEHYERVYEDITVHAKSILKKVQEESKSIVGRFKKDIEVAKSTDEVQLQEFSRKIKQRLEEILTLDPSSGSLKRKCALSLNYQIHHAFNNLQCDIVPKAKRVEEILQILERDILICIDRAKSLIVFCRKCKDPQALTKCIEDNADYAKQILDEASENAQVSLRKAEALKQDTLQCHKTAVAEIVEIYRKKHKVFLEHLDKCISTIRYINKQ